VNGECVDGGVNLGMAKPGIEYVGGWLVVAAGNDAGRIGGNGAGGLSRNGAGGLGGNGVEGIVGNGVE